MTHRWLTAAMAVCLGAGAALAQDADEAWKQELRKDLEARIKTAQQQQDRSQQRLLEDLLRLINERLAENAPKAKPARPPAPRVEEPGPTRDGAPWLGANVAQATEGVRVMLNLGEEGGLVIEKIVEGGPAAKAGLKVNDIVLSIAGTRLGTVEALRDLLATCRPGQGVRIELLRDGQRQELAFTFGRRGEGAAPGPTPPPTRPDVTPPTPPAPPATPNRDGRTGPREAIHRFLRALGEQALERIEGELRGAPEEERAEMRRLVLQKLTDKLRESGVAPGPGELKELRRAVEEGLRRYAELVKVEGKSRAEALAQYLDEQIAKAKAAKGGAKSDAEKLVDDILGGKKPGAKPAKPPGEPGAEGEPPVEIPQIDPQKLQDELQRLRERIDKEGFPQSPAEIGKLMDEVLKRMGMKRETVRNLIEMAGGPEGAKELVRGQMALNGIPLTDADLDRVMKVLMADGAPAVEGKPWLGMSLSETVAGATVGAVVPGGPGEKAGLKEGDVILSLGDVKVSGLDAVKGEMSRRKPGDKLSIRYRRGTNEATADLTLGRKP